MKIDSAAIRRLGETLRSRESVAEETPRAAGQGGVSELSPEVRALMARVAPICEAMYLMMSADGVNDAAEKETVRGAIRELTGCALSGPDIDSMIDRFEHAAEWNASPRLPANWPPTTEDAEAALALAAAVALADGTVDPTEHETMEALAEWLGISNQRAAVILGVD